MERVEVKRLPRLRVAALMVFVVLAGGLVGTWHRHLRPDERTAPAVARSLNCPACAIPHNPAPQPEPPGSNSTLDASPFGPAPQPLVRPSGPERSPRIPRGPPVLPVA